MWRVGMWFLMLTLVSCSARTVGGRNEPVVPVSCCKDYGEVKRFDGKRIVVTGIYTTTAMRKRRADAARDEHDERSRIVQIVPSSGMGLMLEIYHSGRGQRPEAEIARFSGKRVRAVGTLHAATPSHSEDGVVMQTMIGPYLGEIETIEDAP